MKFWPVIVFTSLALAACAQPVERGRDADAANPPAANAPATATPSPDRSATAPSDPKAAANGQPGERAVRIGEGGPRFDACQSVGQLRGRSTLPVRAAPFDSAAQKAEIAGGQFVWICTSSHDQQWLGIVYDDAAPVIEGEGEGQSGAAARGPGDCGVASPVRTKRAYDGPCKSGWAESNFIIPVAG